MGLLSLTKQCIAFLAIVTSAHAATYYVDFVGGSNSNNGTSTATPWKHCRGDQNATGVPGSGSLSAGDTVIFKGGVEYVLSGTAFGGIFLNWSGSTGNPITYDGNSAGTWGTGKAVITNNHASSPHSGFIGTSARSYLTFRNLYFFEIGGSATLPTDLGSAVPENRGVGIEIDGGFDNIIIEDCDFSELGYYFNQQPMSEGSISGFAIWGVDWTNSTVRRCNFSRVNVAIEVSAGTVTNNVLIEDCTFTDSIRWCIDLSTRTSGTVNDNITIRRNRFFDYYQFDSSHWTGYGEWPHTDGIFFRTGDGKLDNHYGSNNNFHNNHFYNTVASTGGTASIYITEGPSANVYNNLFVHQMKSRSISLANGPAGSTSDAQFIQFFNNTFLCDFTMQFDWGGTRGIGMEGDGGIIIDADSNFVAKNNVFFDISNSGAAIMAYSAQGGPVPLMHWDYNCWFSSNPSNEFFYAPNISVGSHEPPNPLSELHAAGWELHGMNADPLFVEYDDLGAPADNNLRLQAGSPARATGENLTSLGLPGLNLDYDGNPRPASGPWDMGAFQASESPPPGIQTINVQNLRVGP